MSIRARLAATFALVALVTAVAVAVATPLIVGRGFSMYEADQASGRGGGMMQGQGPMAGPRSRQIQDETSFTLVAVALAAAGLASLLGLGLASRVARPLSRLEEAADAVARGDLSRRSGVADRGDEIGSLGRSFDAMATSLERTDSSRRRFFQDAAHELRTPLAVIDATATAVLDGVYEHEDRHLETIRDQSRLLARVVDDLRTVSLAEAGALTLRFEDVPVDELLSETARAYVARGDAVAARIRVGESCAAIVRGDRDRLRQALGALLDNAIRHAPGGDIELESRRSPGASGGGGVPGSLIRLGVRDHGDGIDSADLPFLFDRFYRADPDRERSTGTSGLGLAIVRAIAEAHRGGVGAENAEGGGARFWLELPEVAAASSRQAPGSAARG